MAVKPAVAVLVPLVTVSTQELAVPAVLTHAPEAMAALYVPPLVGKALPCKVDLVVSQELTVTLLALDAFAEYTE